MLVIVGVECLLIDSATFAPRRPRPVAVSNGWFPASTTMTTPPQKTVTPSEWMTWSLMASGAVVILYSLTLPKRWAKAG